MRRKLSDKYLIALIVLYTVTVLLLVITLGAPLLGLGSDTGFVLYERFGIRRSDLLMISIALALFPFSVRWKFGYYLVPIIFLSMAFILPFSPRFIIVLPCGLLLLCTSLLAAFTKKISREYASGTENIRIHGNSQPPVAQSLSETKQRVFAGILYAILLIFTISLGEVFLRHHPWGEAYVYYSRYESRPILYFGPFGNELAPQFNGMLYNYQMYSPGSPLKPWRVKINQFGWRELSYAKEKRDGVKRFMVLGDSVTYGMGLDYQDSHPSCLRHILSLDRKNEWEVLNRSVPGWHGWNQLKYFRQDGIQWQPDIVTVNVVMNDFKPLSDDMLEQSIKEPPRSYHFFKRFRFFNMLRVWLMTFKADVPDDEWNFARARMPLTEEGVYGKDTWWYIRGQYDTPEKEETYKEANACSYPRYKQLQEECDKIGAVYLVVIYPASAQVSMRYWKYPQNEEILQAHPINEFCRWLEDNNIPYINLLDVFRAETNHALFLDGSHLTKYGNRIAAIEVIHYLSQRGLFELYAEPFWE